MGHTRVILFMLSLAASPIVAQGPFLHDPGEAFGRARAEKLPVLIEFHATWCEACEIMRRTTWRDADVLARFSRVVPLSVDGERSHNLTARYAVVAYPSIVFAEPGGEPVLVLLGLQDEVAMREHFDAVLERWDELSQWAVAASVKPPDPRALLGLADFAAGRRAFEQAERLYRKTLRGEKRLPESQVSRTRVGLGELLAASGRCRDAAKVLRRVPQDTAGEWAGRLSAALERTSRCAD